MPDNYDVGFVGSYIQDFKEFRRVCEIPPSVAVAWVKATCPPKTIIGITGTEEEMQVSSNPDVGEVVSNWVNKYFIIVESSIYGFVAITNWDGKFSVYKTIS